MATLSFIWYKLEEFVQFVKTQYKSLYNWTKSSVSSMTSAEEGQPPSNEPEE